MEKVRWGILSTANIGTKKVIPATQQARSCVVTAIASRDAASARQVADELGIPTAYGSYEALLADPDIDAVYIPLPNHMHVEWAIKALEAGKHVLCEKPLALTAADAQRLADTAAQYPHLKIMEAFMYRHHPQWRQAQAWVREGQIGVLRTIQTFFAFHLEDPTNIRNRPETGGGGLLDIGCYTVSVARFIFEEELQRVCGIMEYDPQLHIDRLGSSIMDFGRGTATFTYSTQLIPYQRVNIFGTTGLIEIEIPFNAPPDRPCRMWLQTADETRELVLDVCDQYTIQAELFAAAILHDTPVPTPLSDAVANLRAMEAFAQSAASNSWVSLPPA